MTMTTYKNLNNRKLCVIGMGKMGLPLALELGKEIPIIGYDPDKSRISEIAAGIDINNEFDKKEIFSATRIELTADEKLIQAADFYIIMDLGKIIYEKDYEFLDQIIGQIAKVLKVGDIVITKFNSSPTKLINLTEELLEEKSGLLSNMDFFYGEHHVLVLTHTENYPELIGYKIPDNPDSELRTLNKDEKKSSSQSIQNSLMADPR